MGKIADVFINIPIKSIAQAYSYTVPESMDFLRPGCRVVVPFGGRIIEGFAVTVHEADEHEAKENGITLKPIKEVLDTEPWFTKGMYETAKWMADFYMCSLGETMRLFIPGKNSLKIRPVFNISSDIDIDTADSTCAKLNKTEHDLYEYLSECKDADISSLKQTFGTSDEFMPALERLLYLNLAKRSYSYDRQSKKIYVNYAVLTVEPDDIILNSLGRRHAQKRALKLLQDLKSSSVKSLQQQGVSAAVLKALAQQGYIKIEQRRILRDSYAEMRTCKAAERKLTDEQQQALSTIESSSAAGKNKFLLFGVTGSGKTQVYIEMAKKVRREGRQVLILVPEIVLTGQLVTAFKQYFSSDVVVIHSRLSLGERGDAFSRIRTRQAGVVIGARSAIFAPFEDLGLIVMDEEHDPSYKQDESPRYHSHDIVEQMADIYSAVLIMGSATPSMESYYKAQTGRFVLLKMMKRIGDMPLPHIESVDMREELRRGNRKIISYKLKELIEATLAKKQQLIIMLNRRGFATFVMCRSCGHVIKCPQCGLPMVYHRRGILQCHHCDITAPVPDVCPKCASRFIKFFGSGTEKLEEELAQMFPAARIIRLDRDTTGKKFAHQNILKEFRDGHYDILLGTQMVAKGHDIPSVTGVGIISADSSLNLPDFRAPERCFGLITQTAGRAGRGREKGSVVVQTYNPDHYAVQCGIAQDYESFYEQEIAMRRMMYFPPFCSLVKLTVKDTIEENALHKAQQLHGAFMQCFPAGGRISIMGPAPAVIARFNNTYRFNLLIKTDDLPAVCSFLRQQKVHLDSSIAIDVNPINTN